MKQRPFWIMSALVLVVLFGVGLSSDALAQGTTGTISGRVTEIDGVTPIVGVKIYALSVNAPVGTPPAVTNAAGEYTMTLNVGSYRFWTAPHLNYAIEYYDDSPTLYAADIVTVVSGTGNPRIDFALEEEASLTVTVYQPDGITPLPSAYVRLYHAGETPWRFYPLTTEGTITFSYLISGTVYVSAFSSVYGETFYDGGTTLAEAAPITLMAGEDRTDVSITLRDAPRPSLSVMMDMQGRPARPDPRWAVPVTVTLSEGYDNQAVINGQTYTSNPHGVITLSPLWPGVYTLRIKGANTLAVSHALEPLYAGAYSLNSDILPAGDANNDNLINIADFSILAAAFGKASGTPGYDARADFNGDQVITIADFSLLASNFGQQGAP